MRRLYRANVTLFFVAEDDSDACDAVSAMLSENLMHCHSAEDGVPALLDWSYLRVGYEYPGPRTATIRERSEIS